MEKEWFKDPRVEALRKEASELQDHTVVRAIQIEFHHCWGNGTSGHVFEPYITYSEIERMRVELQEEYNCRIRDLCFNKINDLAVCLGIPSEELDEEVFGV